MGIIVMAMTATLLDDRHLHAVREFLHRDPVGNVFPIGVFEQWGLSPVHGGRWLGCMQTDGTLEAVGYAGPSDAEGRASIAVALGDPRVCALLGAEMAREGGASWVIGEEAQSDALWRGLGEPLARVQSSQVLMNLESVTHGTTLMCRAADRSDLSWVLSASHAQLQEDLGVTESRILAPEVALMGEFVGEVDGRRVFRAKVATRCSAGVQVGGVWVDPEYRNRGLGQAGMRGLVRPLLDRFPRVTLHVRTENVAAIQCYQRVGFERERAFRVWVR